MILHRWDISPSAEKGLILEANLTAANMLDMPRSGMLKQPITRVIFQEDQDVFYLHLRQILKTGGPEAVELRMVKINGTIFWARLEATIEQTYPASLLGHALDIEPVCRIIINDISEKKLASIERE